MKKLPIIALLLMLVLMTAVDVYITGEGALHANTRTPGSTVENPMPVTLPLVDFAGDTSLYGDDYEATWVTPTGNYLGGDDMVLQFILTEQSEISGTLQAVTGNWIGMYVVNTAPNPTTPAPVLASATNTGTLATMSPTTLPAGTYYLLISTWPSPQSFQFNLNLSAVSMINPPAPANIVSPSNNATNVAGNASLNWTAGGGAPTGYNLYFGTNNPPTNILNGSDLGNVLTYNPGLLTYSTPYYWQVVPYNPYGNASECPVWSFTTMADPTQPLPYSQDFNSGTSLSAIGWSGAMGIGSGHGNTSNVLYKNLWSSATTTNVVTPPIGPMAANAELMFDYRYVDYDSPYPGIELSAGDNLQIQVSTDNGATFTTIHTIDQSNHITSGSFATVVVELDAYSTGSIMLKFLANWGAGDYYLDIDNVIVRETPLLPIISVTPDSWDFGTQLINTVNAKEFTISNIGAGSLNVSSINVTGTGFALAEAFSPVSLLPLEIASFTVNFSPQTETTYSGNIAINDNRAVTNIPLIGAAIDATIYSGDLPHIENFDSVTIPDLPVGWTSIDNNADNDYWKTATGYANSGDKSASIYTDYNTANDDYLVTPPIELTGSQRLSFWTRARSTSEPEELSVVLSTTTPTSGAFTNVLMTSTPINFTTYTQYNIDLDDYNGICYIAFKRAADPADGYYLYIDDVKIDVILPEPPEPATLVWPLNSITTLPNPLLEWAPSATGEPATGYKVYMNDSGTFTETDLIYEGTATQFQTADMGYERTYYWKVLPINAHGSDPTCPTWSFSTPGEYQLAEGFEATAFPPAGWQRTTSSTSYWGRSTTSPLEGAAGMYAYTSTSTVYTISTPMLTINSSSSLDFFAKVTDVTQKLQILESTDRINWTQVGADITFATANVWNPISVNLSVIEPGNYYLAFSSPVQTTGYKYIYVDHIIGPNITPVVPGAPTLAAPADAAEDQSNYPSFTWTAPTTGGIPTGYNFYLDTVDGSTLYASNVTSPYVPTTALDWEETYYWTVKAFNNAGTGEAPTARSFTVRSDPTIYVNSTTPWLVDFGTVTGDWPVLNWSQLSGLYPTPTGTSTQWYRDNWLNGPSGNNAAKINIYGGYRYGWLVTPPISIPADGYELKFDLGLTDCDYSNPIEDLDAQADDKFMVLVSDYPTMAGATPLRTWDNDSSEYVYNAIPYTGTSITIPLSSISGTKYFAFYGESTVSGNGDNDLFVDNVLIRETVVAAPDPVTLISPADEAENMPVDGFNLTWSPAVTGGTPTGYYVIMGSTADPDYMEYSWELGDVTNFDPTQAAENPVTFAYSETWYWTVMATNGDGDATVPTSFSFTIMDDPRVLSLPYSQNFDGVTAPNLPAQWVGMLNPTSTLWYVDTYSSTTYAVSQPNTARMYNYSSTTADIRLITPEILVPMNSIKLSFSARGSSGYTLLVGTTNATDATGTFNQLASFDLSSTHTIYTVSLADYVGSDQYICFKHGLGSTYRSIYIDDVNMEMLTPYDLAVTDFAGDSYGLAGDQLSYTVTVTNNGTAAQNSYSVQLLSQTRDVLATLNVSESLEPGASAQHIINWTPSIADTYDVYAKVILAGDANPTNDESDIMQVSVFASTSYISAIGDPASTSTVNYLPFNVYYKNNVAEVIYLGSQMQMASGTINAIIYQNNFVQDLTKPVRIWMAHTTESVNSAWLPFVNYTLVFEGNVHFPLGVNAVIIPLDTPFNYTGGNLAVRTYREFEDNWWDTSNHFYYTMDANYPNRTRYLNRDGDTPIDPTAPDANGTATSYIPNTAFIVDPHTAMPPLTAPAVQIAMDGINPKLTWNAVDGAYLYVVQGSDNPYDWSAATELTVTSNLLYTITSAPAKKFYRVLSRSYNHVDREIGQVFNPASVIGFDNSAVKALPLIPNTEDKN